MTSPGSSRAESRLRPPPAHWVDPPDVSQSAVQSLVDELKLPAAMCHLLAARGLHDPDAAKQFLRPSLDQLHDPKLLKDGPEAAARIAAAINAAEMILVHGDYDVDGICATALLTRWLRRLGANVTPFVPHRLRDGYDFSPAGLEAAKGARATLIVTADCGTVAHDTVAEANEAGIDVIVTDHHKVSGSLPEAVALINPQRADCSYPDDRLCGSGVAYKLCELVAEAASADPAPLLELLDLVALATVADLVPLSGENRVLVHYGLRRFAETRVQGIAALLEVAGVKADEVNAGKLGFVVAPRINAAGRIGESADALRLLLTDSSEEASGLATQLDEINRERREEDQRTLDEALVQLESTYDAEKDYGVVVAGDGWHPGVIGIVASRIVDRIHRPVVMIALDGERGRGSGRSIRGFHLYDALVECSEHMRRFGGHAQAAGMDVDRSSVEHLRAAFNAVAHRVLEPDALIPRRKPDMALDLADADLALIHWMKYLGPHGIGNPGPLLLSKGVVLERPKVVGDNHLKVRLRMGTRALDAIGFGLADDHPPDDIGGETYDVLYRLERNEWRDSVRPQAVLDDLRASR